MPIEINKPLKVVFASSYAALYAVKKISEKLNKIKNLQTKVVPVKSNYWGENITVAGLITSDDLVNSIKSEDCDIVVIPTVMLRPYSEDFLDGNNLDYVRKKSGKKFFIMKDNYSMFDFIDYIKNLK